MAGVGVTDISMTTISEIVGVANNVFKSVALQISVLNVGWMLSTISKGIMIFMDEIQKKAFFIVDT
eukprot:CAMPEP_0116919302 /NCGR_PEP_ID=MMETSP0467-20121206/20300_1 /TAXON_ID=283647 /ORGANISM="Mesodinium pulex, Strain SPMC105" /LENGTH=65 /DNA_ID=CAMNT_0004596845 /DNA_START=612 /DNA_END=809 /DNA_ORIENTATION=-